MAQPPGYTPTTDFSNDERDNVGGRSTARTAALDGEFTAIKATLDAVLVNLSANQRDDGEIRDGRVKLFTLASDVLALLTSYGATPRGAWLTATQYNLKDLVSQSGNTYIAVTAHLSGVFATDLAAGKWLLFSLSAAPSATLVTFTPSTGVSATNVQAAIQEVDAEYRAADVMLQNNINAANLALASLISDLADTSNATKNAGQIGFSFSLNYAANTIGWAEKMTHAGAYNVLRQILPSQWAAILAGTSTDDHTAAIAAANTASKAAGQPLFFPAGKYNNKPTAPLEHFSWVGAGPSYSVIYTDGTGQAVGKVAYRNTGGEWQGLTLRETTLSKTRAIMLQMSDATATNAVGGSLAFTGYTHLRNVWVFGGLIALDIGNVFTCNYYGCRFNQAGTGVNCTPADDAGDNGYSNTQAFHGCEIADNNKNLNIGPMGGQLGSLAFYGGSVERGLVSSSTFAGITTLAFYDVYLEQAVAISPVTISASAVFARFRTSGSNCDLTLGTNCEITLDGWKSGSNHLLGGDGTQRVTLLNCQFPATGNSGASSFARFTAINSDYNGVSYDATSKSLGTSSVVSSPSAPVIAVAATIAPTSTITYLTGAGTVNTITPPSAGSGGTMTLGFIFTGGGGFGNAGNINEAWVPTGNRVAWLTWEASASKWFRVA